MTEVKDIIIGPQELVFNNNQSGGGFSVGDILNKSGISTIMTTKFDTQTGGGSSSNVSDLFQHLAIPSWATMYNMHGGEYKKKDDDKSDTDSDSDSDIDDDLHDKLLALVREHDNKLKPKHKNSNKRGKTEKKNITKKNKVKK
jgi:hypothetical protein